MDLSGKKLATADQPPLWRLKLIRALADIGWQPKLKLTLATDPECRQRRVTVTYRVIKAYWVNDRRHRMMYGRLIAITSSDGDTLLKNPPVWNFAGLDRLEVETDKATGSIQFNPHNIWS